MLAKRMERLWLPSRRQPAQSSPLRAQLLINVGPGCVCQLAVSIPERGEGTRVEVLGTPSTEQFPHPQTREVESQLLRRLKGFGVLPALQNVAAGGFSGLYIPGTALVSPSQGILIVLGYAWCWQCRQVAKSSFLPACSHCRPSSGEGFNESSGRSTVSQSLLLTFPALCKPSSRQGTRRQKGNICLPKLCPATQGWLQAGTGKPCPQHRDISSTWAAPHPVGCRVPRSHPCSTGASCALGWPKSILCGLQEQLQRCPGCQGACDAHQWGINPHCKGRQGTRHRTR